MSSVKITIFGAGSVVFSLALVKDVCLTQSLAGSTICFTDINEERLDTIFHMATRYAEDVGASLKFEKTTDRRIAFKDADFVVSSATVNDEYYNKRARDLADSMGYFYGRTGMPTYWNLQLMLDVARDMEDLCPDAWLIQAGNPVSAGTTLVTRETDIKMVGLCHGHYGYKRVAKTIGIEDVDNITWQAPGLNHNIWLTDFYYKGQDLYPRVDEWIKNEAEAFWAEHENDTEGYGYQMSRAAIHQYKMYGLMPIGDTPRSGGWWYHNDTESNRRWYGGPDGGGDTPGGRDRVIAGKEIKYNEMIRAAFDKDVRPSDLFGTERSAEQHVPIIDALVNDHEGQFQVNVPNYGALPGLPDDVAVEVPAVVNIKGIQPIRVQPLPQKIMLCQIYPNWLQNEVAIEALLTGDKSLLLYGVLESHQTQSYDQAVELIDAMFKLAETDPSKPMAYVEAIKDHYRYPDNW